MNELEALYEELDRIEGELERRQASKRANRWCPHKPTPKQTQFLELDTFEALFGGAAGGGKSDCLLMGALQYADIPGTASLLLRRKAVDLTKPGALLDRAAEWLRPTAARWNENKRQWRFPSGHVLQFGHIEHEKNKYDYQGGEYQFVGFDELSHFHLTQYTYLLSRVRRTQELGDVPLRVRGATNPGGPGHEWIKERFVDSGPERPFVPALLDDNPHLDAEEYIRALGELDSITLRQLRWGEWIRNSEGLIYPIGPRNIIPERPTLLGQWLYTLGVDLGASAAKPSTAFCVVGSHKKIRGTWVCESHAHAGMGPTDIAEEIKRLERQYGGFLRIVVDGGGLGGNREGGYIGEFRKRHAIPAEAAQKTSKLGYRWLLRDEINKTRILIVEPANRDLINECKALEWNEAGTDNEEGASDHLSDALLYGWREHRAYGQAPPEYRPPPDSLEAQKAREKAIVRQEELEVKRARRRVKGPTGWHRR